MSLQTMMIANANASGRALPRLDVSAPNALAERTIQDLIFHNPALIDFNAAGETDRLIPVAQELAVGGGYIDNIYVDATGRLTIVETKLARNPESHRKVVSQIIDYAATLAAWSYERLNDAVRDATGGRDLDTVVRARVSDEATFARFQRGLAARLATADFELLIVGDRIQERAIRLADAIVAAPALRFRLSLIELAIHPTGSDSAWPWVVVPRLVEKVVEHERFVVRVEHAGATRPTVKIEAGTGRGERGEDDEGRGAVGDPATFFNSPDLPDGFGEAFRAATERWVAAGGIASPTAKSFRWRFDNAFGAQFPLIAHTDDVQINRTIDDVLGVSPAAFEAYARAIGVVPSAASAMKRGRLAVPLAELTLAQLNVMLDATLALAEDLKRPAGGSPEGNG